MQLNDAAAAVAWYQKSDALRASDASLLARMADAQARAGQVDAARATTRARAREGPEPPARARSVARRLQAR